MAPTFASAAASGGNPNSSRADGASEWSRRANGATQTFRRTSQAPTTSSSATPASATTPREPLPPSNSSHPQRNSSEVPGVYVPPHVNASRNGSGPNTENLRYSKDRVLDIFRVEQEAGNLIEGLASLYVGSFQPSASNGVSGGASSWGRRDEQKENNHSVELCWDRNAHMFPMGLQDWTDEERDLFNGSVNSPIKPPTLTNKEGGAPKDGATHRKTSISQSLNSPGAFGLTSPTQSRPGNRRRDTSEAYPFPNTSLASPSSSRFSREEVSAANPPAALLRRRTEQQKDAPSGSGEERDRDKNEPAPGGGLKRSATGGLGASGTSTWGASGTSAFSPMGSFGNFALGAGATQSPATEKRPGYGSVRGQSRFAGMMKDSSVDLKEKTSSGDLGRHGDMEQERHWMEQRQNRPYGEDAELYADEEGVPSGSAALGGGLDDSPPKQQRGFGGFGGPSSRMPDDGGFSALGMTADTVGYHDFSHQTPQQHRQHGGDGVHEPMSPTNTNPYQSPENERNDMEEMHEGHDVQHGGPLPGLGGFRGANQGQGGLPGLGSNFPGLAGRMPSSYEVAASDRSQTSSTGPTRGFPSLSGLGGLPGLGGGASPWSAGPQGIGTPTRDRSGLGGGFGEGMMTSGADMQSPVLAGLGGANFGGPGGFGSVRSKMGSLFPSAMQEQMRMGEGGMPGQEEQGFDPFARQHSGLGPLSRGPLNTNVMGSAGPARDTESPFRNNRAMFEDLLDQTPRNEMPSAIGEPSGMFAGMQSSQTPLSSVPSQDPLGLARKSQSNLQRQSSNLTSPSSSQPPLQQMRTMVMPDRMRWIYKDPQGSTQGPWSGLEMHDWYRAGFFTPELLIKRVEDPEFEPLAQLIRRIGNSREPFLVPQIGVPHESSNAPGKPPVAVQPGGTAAGVQPPFPNSFPSFGTTLTAEQQNALERRKQEEQFLMARQKEHLAQQQLYIKQQIGMQGSGGPQSGAHGLIHHSSAHSLHSQPSFGSVTSPAAYQPSPTQGPMTGGPAVPGFFDGAFRGQQQGQGGVGPEGLGSIREGDMPGMMERMNLNNNNRGAGAQQPGQQLPLGQGLPDEMQSAQIAAMLQDRARLQREQAEHDRRESGPDEEEREALAAQERFQQFHDLRAQHDDVAAAAHFAEEQEMRQQHAAERERQLHELAREQLMQEDEEPEETLTQQVQAASAAKQASAQQSPWGKIDAVHHANIADRPPQSASPMPAPIAQRKHNVADNLVAETRSGTQSPAVDTPTTSVAPWANQSVEVPKTLSLKEIQEAEAKRAAKQEALAAAERRAAYERELAAAQAAASVAPAPGLPTGATWATQSPATSTGSAPSVWGAKTAAKPNVGKTLQQIQKEEEAKKQRAAIVAAANAISTAGPPPPSAGGKRYADLAGKSASPASPVQAAGWSTVGAGGKVKASATSPASATSATMPGRSVSGSVATVTGMKPSPVSRSTTMGAAQLGKLSKADAVGEFKKWAAGELQRGGLHPNINASDFIETLLVIGSEVDIITEAVHGSAQTIDSRHFAEEFVRRKKQADKGVVESIASPGTAKANDNAWSAVAKKGQTPGATAAAPVPPASGEFKVAKAKGRRK